MRNMPGLPEGGVCRVIVMPANAAGWFWHCLARETGKIGHLYSPRDQRGPWPWLPYAFDNGAFSCWDQSSNTFNEAKWDAKVQAWREMLFWSQVREQKPRWAIVPDVPGNCDATLERWSRYAGEVASVGIPLALAVQDGMTPDHVRELDPFPEVICVGGTTDWKWETVSMWVSEFDRVHVLRCNAPDKLQQMEDMGVESTDGTGWNRGDRKQTTGLETWARMEPTPTASPIAGFVCRQECKRQITFA